MASLNSDLNRKRLFVLKLGHSWKKHILVKDSLVVDCVLPCFFRQSREIIIKEMGEVSTDPETRATGNRLLSRFYRYRAADLYVDTLETEQCKAFLANLINIPDFQNANFSDRKAIVKRVSAGLRFDLAQQALREATKDERKVHFSKKVAYIPAKKCEEKAPPNSQVCIRKTCTLVRPLTDLIPKFARAWKKDNTLNSPVENE